VPRVILKKAMNTKPITKHKKTLTSSAKFATIKKHRPVLSSQETSRGVFDPKESYLLIDGENFVHRIEEILKDAKLINSRKDLKKINFNRLFNLNHFSEKRYYSTTLRSLKKDHPLRKKTEQIKSWESTWIPFMLFCGITNIKAGYLRVRSRKKCFKCATISEFFTEKGVDVRIAVDMITRAKPSTTIHLVSSDTDLLPAIAEARHRGAKIVYVAFEGKNIKAISQFASSTIIIRNSQVKKSFKDTLK
jgi:uncharacterized LabA/DUF88 family protein